MDEIEIGNTETQMNNAGEKNSIRGYITGKYIKIMKVLMKLEIWKL